MPSVSAAIQRDCCTCRIIGVVNVAASIAGEGQLLTPVGEGAHVPPCACERPLRVLSFETQDSQAVRLQLQRSTDKRGIQPEARVDRGQRDRHLLLDVVDPQPLERPTGDRDVAVGVDPLDIDRASQAVVLGNVVAPRDRLVGSDPGEAGYAPLRVKLRFPVRFEIGANALFARLFRLAEFGQPFDAAVGKEAANLEGADAVQFTILGFDRRAKLRVDVRGDCQVAVGTKPPVIRDCDFKSSAARDAEIGNEDAADAAGIAPGRNAEDR